MENQGNVVKVPYSIIQGVLVYSSNVLLYGQPGKYQNPKLCSTGVCRILSSVTKIGSIINAGTVQYVTFGDQMVEQRESLKSPSILNLVKMSQDLQIRKNEKEIETNISSDEELKTSDSNNQGRARSVLVREDKDMSVAIFMDDPRAEWKSKISQVIEELYQMLKKEIGGKLNSSGAEIQILKEGAPVSLSVSSSIQQELDEKAMALMEKFHDDCKRIVEKVLVQHCGERT